MLTMTRWGGLVRAWEAVNGYRYFFKGTGGQTPLASKAERTFPPTKYTYLFTLFCDVVTAVHRASLSFVSKRDSKGMHL